MTRLESLLPGEYEDVSGSISFETERDPANAVLVLATIAVFSTGGVAATVEIDVGGVKRVETTVHTTAGGLSGDPDTEQTETLTFAVPRGWTYMIRNVADPGGVNAIHMVHEMPL